MCGRASFEFLRIEQQGDFEAKMGDAKRIAGLRGE